MLKPLLIDLDAEMPTRANQTELELAWAAGFIDGEGCISSCENTHKNNKRRWFQAFVDVSQVRREPLDKLAEIFGGRVRVRRSVTEYGVSYIWRAYAENAAFILRSVLPYLVLKRRQAELVIELQETKRIGREWVPEEVHARRMAIHYELRALNSKRTPLSAERLSEEAPSEKKGDAIVRSHGKKNHEKSAEMTDSVQ